MIINLISIIRYYQNFIMNLIHHQILSKLPSFGVFRVDSISMRHMLLPIIRINNIDRGPNVPRSDVSIEAVDNFRFLSTIRTHESRFLSTTKS